MLGFCSLTYYRVCWIYDVLLTAVVILCPSSCFISCDEVPPTRSGDKRDTLYINYTWAVNFSYLSLSLAACFISETKRRINGEICTKFVWWVTFCPVSTHCFTRASNQTLQVGPLLNYTPHCNKVSELEVYLHPFLLILALDRREWLASCPCRFLSGEGTSGWCETESGHFLKEKISYFCRLSKPFLGSRTLGQTFTDIIK